jgi:hypothetical protein
VAIKVIRVGLTSERVDLVGAQLVTLRQRMPEHPAIPPLLDAGIADGEPYLVSPLVDGDSLDVALRQYGPAHPVDALPRLRTLADALDLAAAAGLAHGSLHPRDIVVSVERTVVTSLGVAPILERVGVRPPVRRPYCAPEVALGHGFGHAGDQYSLAAIAYEWLSGRRLSDPDELRVVLPGLGPESTLPLTDVFCRALAKEPEARYATATAFVEAVAAAAPALAPKPRSARRAPKIDPPRLAFDEEAPEAVAPAPAFTAGEIDLPLRPSDGARAEANWQVDPSGRRDGRGPRRRRADGGRHRTRAERATGRGRQGSHSDGTRRAVSDTSPAGH